MTKVVVLDEQSFYLDASHQASQRQTMKLRLGGSVLVLFTMPRCRGCNAFKPLFRQLAANDPHLSFAEADLSFLKNVVSLSRASTTPLQSVPTLILYSEGLPRAKFKGNMNLPSVESFLAKGLNAVAATRGGRPPPRPPYPVSHGGAAPRGGPPVPGPPSRYGSTQNDQNVPYATLGNPEDDDDVCLLMPNGICPHNQPWSSEFKQV